MRRRTWPTFRLRAAALFLLVFVAAGGLLLVLTYVLVQHALSVTGTTLVLRGQTFPGAPVPPSAPATVEQLRGFMAAYRQALHDETLHELLVQSGIALCIATAAGVLGAWLLAGRLVRPLRRITDAAGRLSQETLDQRIALRGHDDELRQLADSFDAMLARLQVAFDGQRRFVANVSHELRGPLATQRTLIEVALASPNRSTERLTRTLGALLASVEEQQRLVEGLLALAASERGFDHGEAVDMRSLVEEAVATGRSHAARRGVVIEADLSTAATIGHAPLLRRMVGNLVENGVTYNRAGGWLRLRLRLSASGSGPTLEVANSGPVVARDRVESLFEPFRRLEGDRTSTSGLGLGLSIVRAVVHAHGGTIQAAPGREGGLEITVGLPGARQPARR